MKNLIEHNARILVIGYGNPDRQDDGVAWHVLCGLSKHLGRPVPAMDEGFFPTGDNPDLMFVLQLTPDLAEKIADYEKVCFVDAHIGAFTEPIRVLPLKPSYQSSAFTHHMKPETCMALVFQLYNMQPDALIVSVKGDAFEFTDRLSPAAANRIHKAVDIVTNFCQDKSWHKQGHNQFDHRISI